MERWLRYYIHLLEQMVTSLDAPISTLRLLDDGERVVRLTPGKDSTTHHYHDADEEFIYVLEGSGRARIGDQSEVLDSCAGPFAVIPIVTSSAGQVIRRHNSAFCSGLMPKGRSACT